MAAEIVSAAIAAASPSAEVVEAGERAAAIDRGVICSDVKTVVGPLLEITLEAAAVRHAEEGGCGGTVGEPGADDALLLDIKFKFTPETLTADINISNNECA